MLHLQIIICDKLKNLCTKSDGLGLSLLKSVIYITNYTDNLK